MIYGLFIHDSPNDGEAFHSAARFAEAALTRGHVIRQIFLYGDAVLASRHPMPSGLKGLDRLIDLARRQGVPVLACQAALERLAIDVDTRSGISVGSLGQWFDAIDDMDRIMEFAS